MKNKDILDTFKKDFLDKLIYLYGKSKSEVEFKYQVDQFEIYLKTKDTTSLLIAAAVINQIGVCGSGDKVDSKFSEIKNQSNDDLIYTSIKNLNLAIVERILTFFEKPENQ
jgi:hypothetical protein